MKFSGFAESKEYSGNSTAIVDIAGSQNGGVGPDTPAYHQIDIEFDTATLTAGTFTITAKSAMGPDIFQPVYEADETTAMTITATSAGYRTKVIGPTALRAIKVVASSTSGTGGWKLKVASGMGD